MTTQFRTVYESLSFDTIVMDHADRAAAERYMVGVLTDFGDWPRDAALTAAAEGRTVLVADNGDDETIRIEAR